MRNKTLDLIKLFSAYAVVFIHFRIPGISGAFIDAIARFAVPLFFLISGYYVFNNDGPKIKKKILNIGKIYLFSTVFYTVFTFLLKSAQVGFSDGAKFIASIFDMGNIIKFFLFNRTVSSEHLWFLPALLCCYLLYYLLKKFNVRQRSLCVLSVVLLIINLLLGEFSDLIGFKLINCVTRNYLFTGFPFFALGLIVREYEEKIIHFFRKNVLVILVIVGLLATLISHRFLGRHELYVGSVFITFALFIAALRCRNVTYPAWVERLLPCNTYIYIFHMFIGRLLKAGIVNIIANNDVQVVLIYLLPVLTCILTTVFSFGVLQILKRRRKNDGRNHVGGK